MIIFAIMEKTRERKIFMKKTLKAIAISLIASILLCSCSSSGKDESTTTSASTQNTTVSSTSADGTTADTTDAKTTTTTGEKTENTTTASAETMDGKTTVNTAAATTTEKKVTTANTTTTKTTTTTTTARTTSATTTTVNVPVNDGTPFENHGALRVDGANLVDSSGKKYQLYGMSTHGIAWFPQYVNYQAFRTLTDDWNTNCVRLAMYTYEYNGYCNGGDKEYLKQLIKNGVDYATQLGMYVIIDWHVLNDKNPLVYKDEAAEFFGEMSALYADYDNVIYEICNEPNSTASWSDVKTYANEIIPIIRANDSNCVILVGTPTWSQDIDQAAASPLAYDNIMYTLHFYAATHGNSLRNRMETCIKNGLPVFVSEFGICDASGNGNVSIRSANSWKELIEKYNVSYMCWNLSNKNESSSVFLSSCIKTSDWADNQLSEQGLWIKEWFKSETNK